MNRKSLLLGAIGAVCAAVMPKRASANFVPLDKARAKRTADEVSRLTGIPVIPAPVVGNAPPPSGASYRLTKIYTAGSPTVTCRLYVNGQEVPVAWEAPADSHFVRVACDLPTMTARVVRAKG